MAKKKLKSPVHTTIHNLFRTGVRVIPTSSGILIPAPKIHQTIQGTKTVINLPGDVIIKKHEVFFEKILFNHHPKFNVSNARNLVADLGGPTSFNVEKLVEDALAAVGGYNVIGGVGQDFDDIENSDGKTVSVNVNTGVAELSSISAKIGTLRIMIYNPFEQDIHYFYLTFEQWTAMATATYTDTGKGGTLRLRFQYSIDGHYNQFESFRVPDFITLATKMTLQDGWNVPVLN
jgi:hypothetical protein